MSYDTAAKAMVAHAREMLLRWFAQRSTRTRYLQRDVGAAQRGTPAGTECLIEQGFVGTGKRKSPASEPGTLDVICRHRKSLHTIPSAYRTANVRASLRCR